MAADKLAAAVTDRTACVMLQHPNFFGCLEDVAAAAEIAHRNGALFVVVFDPISLGLLKRPGDYGADIAVAEGQSLGSPMAFGGPYLGILACREQFLAVCPDAWWAKLSPPPQTLLGAHAANPRTAHSAAKRPAATSARTRRAAGVAGGRVSGDDGPGRPARGGRIVPAKGRLCATATCGRRRFRPAFDRPTFKEFVVRVPGGRVDDRLEAARREGIFAGFRSADGIPAWLTACWWRSPRRERKGKLIGWSNVCSRRISIGEVCAVRDYWLPASQTIRSASFARRRRIRNEDAWRLAAAGRGAAAIYLWGYAAEMTLKAAWFTLIDFRQDRAIKRKYFQTALRSAQDYAIALHPNLHDLPNWAQLLMQHRIVLGRVYPSALNSVRTSWSTANGL